jgi:murein DD-endopeptidase MepM/ murein hydrolase activator NlpD
MIKKIVVLLLLSIHSFAGEHFFVIQKGDSLSKIFNHIGISQSVLANLMRSSTSAQKLNNLKIGNTITITTTNKKLQRIVYGYSSQYNLVVDTYGARFITKLVKNTTTSPSQKKYQKYQFGIKHSLFVDGKKSGLSFKQLQHINTELGKYINTNKLQKNDKFEVFFDDEKLVALRFFGDKKLQLFAWGNTFYNADGMVVYDMFLSQPLKYKRISSGFTYRRYHPILKVYRPHRAIDYAANKGEKVWATASGKIIKKGYYGALGNTIEVKHKYGYSTVYAHLSRFANINTGDRVRQGQVIGYVGSTGRSTGNHLHYELKHGDKYFNPLKYNPQLRFSLKGKELEKFKKYIRKFK